jgi:ferritin-like protein
MASEEHGESSGLQTEQTRTMHRALVSVMEELEAIDWYQQRADACADLPLKDVLLHNRNEEIEHATMLMEWIRRHDGHFDEMMRKYLFTGQPITGIETRAETDAPARPAVDATLGIGSMRGK